MATALLGDDEVHVWTSALDGAQFGDRGILDVLDAEERARAGRFHSDRNQQRFGRAHAILRHVLSRYVGRPPQEIRFGTTPTGKPFLASPEASSIQFSFSRSAEYCAVAVRRQKPVGIDIEKIRSLTDILDIAHRYFHARESEQLRMLSGADRQCAFFFMWCHKEACTKLVGAPLTDCLPHFQFELLSGSEENLLLVNSGSVTSPIATRSVRVERELAGALATFAPLDAIIHRIWTP
jgi:4'-phosphopantetheinyl transferase